MKASDLKKASAFAKNYGVKAIIFGPPGSGKTPLINTLNPSETVLCATEPGLKSMEDSEIEAWCAFDALLIDEFFDWFFGSSEVNQYKNLAIDSVSQMAELYFQAASKKYKDGRKVYGKMAEAMTEKLNQLFYAKHKNIILLAKQEIIDVNGMKMKRPYFPGQYLPVFITHLFDEVLNLGLHNIPGAGIHKALQCQESFDIIARDRTGKLDMFEQADLTALFNKLN